MELKSISFNHPLDPELFSATAQQAACKIAEARNRTRTSNNSTQLRKFYDELVMWNEKIHLERGDAARAAKYKELAPFIKMLNAKVAYAKGRGHVDAEFEHFFSHCIKEVKDADSLKFCKLFMEAFMGFYKAEEGR